MEGNIHNYKFFLNIDKNFNYKFYVDDNKLYIDERYLQFICRWYTNDSRYDIIKPIMDLLIFLKNKTNPLYCRNFAIHIKDIIYNIYGPTFEEFYDQINIYTDSICDLDIYEIDPFNFNNIKPIIGSNINLFIKNDIFIAPDNGFIFIILVGGGAGGSYGGYCNKVNRFSGGEIICKLMYINKGSNILINIGKGGIGGSKLSFDKTYQATNGQDTSILFGVEHIIAKGGYENPYNSRVINNKIIQYISNIKNIFPNNNIKINFNKKNINGLIVDDNDIKAENGEILKLNNNGIGGLGYGAGGGCGSYNYDSFEKKGYYGKGGCGSQGCAIIGYVNYSFF